MKTVFDTPSTAMRIYLHLSYGFSLAFVTLMIHEIVSVVYKNVTISIFDFLTPVNFITLFIATLVTCASLYLHLPKMIVRCFTIGKKFGL
jgi:hypothetical protein